MLDTLRKGLLKKGVLTKDYPGGFDLDDQKRLLLENNPRVEELGKKLNDRIRKAFGRSLAIREVDAGSCNGCEVEVNALSNAIYDIERFGLHVVASPRHADMLLVTGPVTRNMEHALRQTYDATPAPKLVVAMGACAKDGGIFRDSYAVLNGVNNVVPVDVYIPGCPPRPEAIIQGIMLALDKLPQGTQR